ncbi:uncharacterized protein LOC144153672 isoform X1 [Haemaphysalis longicornis]
MKTALLLSLAVVCLLSVAVADRKASNSRQQFDQWRDCMVKNLPDDKVQEYQTCHDRAQGTNMRKFREGLTCVLGSYGLVNKNTVDLRAMAAAARNVKAPELKKAFEECPKDDRNAQIARNVKCVIDGLEKSCPVPAGVSVEK